MHLTIVSIPGKGGKEASRSNAILHRIITDAIMAAAPEVGRHVISLVTTREGVDDLLALDDVIDLVRPILLSCLPGTGNLNEDAHLLVLDDVINVVRHPLSRSSGE